MQIRIGDTIRALRKRDDRTQEALASAIGVTYQAVSRWEVGDGYPDMELIPAIANYFHVTIDELFGYESDRAARIRSILHTADLALHRQGDMTETIAMLREATEEFPAEGSLLVRLGYAYLYEGYRLHGARQHPPRDGGFATYDTAYNAQNPLFIQALSAWEKALTLPITAEERDSILPQMVRHFAITGNTTRARALSEEQTAMGASRELLLCEAADGEERVRRQDSALFALADRLANTLLGAVCTHALWYKTSHGVDRLLDAIRLMEGLLDREMGTEQARALCHSRLADLYRTCSLWMADADGGVHTHEAAALYRKFRHHVLVAEELTATPVGEVCEGDAERTSVPPLFPIAAPAEEQLAGFWKSAPTSLRQAVDESDGVRESHESRESRESCE